MPGARNELGWLLAVVLAGTTALFAWQYAHARSETATLRTDFDALRKEYNEIYGRLEAQQAANEALMHDTATIQEQLTKAIGEIEALHHLITPSASPDTAAPSDQP